MKASVTSRSSDCPGGWGACVCVWKSRCQLFNLKGLPRHYLAELTDPALRWFTNKENVVQPATHEEYFTVEMEGCALHFCRIYGDAPHYPTRNLFCL